MEVFHIMDRKWWESVKRPVVAHPPVNSRWCDASKEFTAKGEDCNFRSTIIVVFIGSCLCQPQGCANLCMIKIRKPSDELVMCDGDMCVIMTSKHHPLKTRVDSTDPQTSNIPIWRYHCLGEVVFLKIWNQYWLPSDTVHHRILFISPTHLQT